MQLRPARWPLARPREVWAADPILCTSRSQECAWSRFGLSLPLIELPSRVAAMSAVALTLVTGCEAIYTCDGSNPDGQAILIGGRHVLGLLLPPQADALAAALPSLTQLDATGGHAHSSS